jgi:hypothetical protein
MNKVFFMKKLFNLNMQEGSMITNHLNELNTLTS